MLCHENFSLDKFGDVKRILRGGIAFVLDITVDDLSICFLRGDQGCPEEQYNRNDKEKICSNAEIQHTGFALTVLIPGLIDEVPALLKGVYREDDQKARNHECKSNRFHFSIP
jgi:hypothetical protein